MEAPMFGMIPFSRHGGASLTPACETFSHRLSQIHQQVSLQSEPKGKSEVALAPLLIPSSARLCSSSCPLHCRHISRCLLPPPGPSVLPLLNQTPHLHTRIIHEDRNSEYGNVKRLRPKHTRAQTPLHTFPHAQLHTAYTICYKQPRHLSDVHESPAGNKTVEAV